VVLLSISCNSNECLNEGRPIVRDIIGYMNDNYDINVDQTYKLTRIRIDRSWTLDSTINFLVDDTIVVTTKRELRQLYGKKI
jgi:hypothetical protein